MFLNSCSERRALSKKVAVNQQVVVREPRQQRSRYKVQLILEAAQQLIERDGLETLTTNAVAALAGVSIGTLYQFFPNKEAILDTLADREVTAMSAKVIEAMEDPAIVTPKDRIAAVVHAVAASYGGRHEAHRLVMAYSLNRGGNRLAPLLSRLTNHLASERRVGPIRHGLPRTDAFVLAHAFAGVLRAMINHGDEGLTPDEIADSLARLVVSFVQ
jgi:AcrR family transcriptional regulator